MNLWLVRHAQPLVEAGLCYGALDMAANHALTQACAAKLAKVVPLNTLVVSSPLQRCEQLAHDLCGLRPDLVYKTDLRLREMDFGCYEGVPWSAIDPAAIAAWTDDFWLHRFGGAESLCELMQRVGAAWDAWCAADRSAVWITHAGVVRACTVLAKGEREVRDARQWPRDALAFGAWQLLTPPI